MGERTLWERLGEAKLLVSKDKDRHTKKLSIGGRHTSVIHLRLSLLLGATGTTGTEAEDGPGDPAPGEVFPKSVPDPVAATGTANGNKPPAGGPARPPNGAVPDAPVPPIHKEAAARTSGVGAGAHAKPDGFTQHVVRLFESRGYHDD
jgi:hypothetical protein